MRAITRSIAVPKLSIRLRRLRVWSAPLLEAATRTRGYPAWLMVGIKAVVTIGLLTSRRHGQWSGQRKRILHSSRRRGEGHAVKAKPAALIVSGCFGAIAS